MVALHQAFQPIPILCASGCIAKLTIGLSCFVFTGDRLGAEPVSVTTLEQATLTAPSPWPANPENNDVLTAGPSATAPAREQEVGSHERNGALPEVSRLVNPAHDVQGLIPGSQNTPSVTSRTHDNDTWQREFASVIKEAVRPTYQDISDSGFIEAIRSIESDLGLSNKRPFGTEAGAYAGNSESEPHRASAGWATPGSNAGANSRPRSEEEIKRDQIMAKVMLKELIDEVKPWVFTLIGLYAIGYVIKFLLDYRRWKIARRRKHTSSGKRRRHHGHSGHGDLHSVLPSPDSIPEAAQAPPPRS